MIETLQQDLRDRRTLFWGLVVPLSALVIGLKAFRVFSRPELSSWWAPLELLRSDVLFLLALAILSPLVFRGLSNLVGSAPALGILQAGAITWAAIEVIAHHFFMVTGSTFDLHLLFFSLSRFTETFTVIASEVPPATWSFLTFIILTFLVVPWGLRSHFQQSSKAPRVPRWTERPSWMVGAASALILVSALPAAGEEYVAFGRTNVLNLALSLYTASSIEQDLVHREPLTALSLRPSPDADADRPQNLVVVVLESTRARSMTVYNPDLQTTPFLADLAAKSLVADRAYSVVPHTSKALVATLCGLEPRLRMPITEARPGGLPARCIADLLSDQGYRSVFLQSATERFEDRPGLVENMGYDDFIPLELMDTEGFEKANYFGKEDNVMLPPSHTWLSELPQDQPFFATYLTLTPHHDYLAPRRFGRLDFVEDDELNRYKNTLYYVDQFSRLLLEQYKELGLYEDTLFVFIGDHGEGFNEHGRSQHDNVIWEEGVHVPLIIYNPRSPDGQRISAPVSQIDLAPTVFDLLGFDVQGGSYPGYDIRQAPLDRAVFSHCWYEQRCMARIAHQYKFIDHFGRRRPEVFDLLNDPLELTTLLGQRPGDEQRWRAELHGWRHAVNELYRLEQADHVQEALVDSLPDGATPLDFDLGDYVRFRGYLLESDHVRRGHRITVTYYFEVLKPLPSGYALFVHGHSHDGSMINLDHIPVQGLHPLDEWEAGTIVSDRHTFRVPRTWSPGSLRLFLGIYHPDSGRLPIFGDVETDGDRRALIFEIPVR